MEVKELMIGDLVLCDGKVMEVGALSTYDIQADLFIEDELAEQIWAEDMDSISGIPLTAEILEKNGWEECNVDIEDDDKQYGVTYGDFSFTWWRDARLLGCYRDSPTKSLYYEMITELPIDYVHQLQHALRLCGIEKEIEL